jgi:hypothetical protein
VFGETKVVLATTLIDGIDAVVTLGTDYLDKQIADPTTEESTGSTEPVDSTPAPGDTVAVDD